MKKVILFLSRTLTLQLLLTSFTVMSMFEYERNPHFYRVTVDRTSNTAFYLAPPAMEIAINTFGQHIPFDEPFINVSVQFPQGTKTMLMPVSWLSSKNHGDTIASIQDNGTKKLIYCHEKEGKNLDQCHILNCMQTFVDRPVVFGPETGLNQCIELGLITVLPDNTFAQGPNGWKKVNTTEQTKLFDVKHS